MVTFSLAVRNLLRNRRRSLATLLAMAIGSTSILLFGGYRTNIDYTMHTAYVQKGGHLQIQHRDFYLYGSGNPTAYGITDYIALLAAIQNDEVLRGMVRVATPTLQFGGIAGNYAAAVSRTIIGNGFVAEDINSMRRWNDFDLRTRTPEFPLEGAAPDAAIVGTGVARVLQLCDALPITHCPKPETEPPSDGKSIPDDIAQLSQSEALVSAGASGDRSRRIEVLASSARGTPNVTSLDVIRAEDQGFKEMDDVYVMMHLARAQQLIYGKSPPKATSIVLQLQHTEQMPAALARLAPILTAYSVSQPLTVMDFRTLNPFYIQTIQLFNTIFGFIFALISAIVLFTVTNTMNTAVVERTVEIGTLRAMGLRRVGIRRLFVTEGALLGACGALLGVVLALLIAGSVNQIGLTWSPPGTVEALSLTLRVWGEVGLIFGTTLGLVGVAILSAWWPAYRAAKMEVTEALRHV